MILLKQNGSGILGSAESISQLAAKESARLLTISDSHGNPSLFQQIVERYGKDCDALIFAGDGINDLITVLEHAQKDENLMASLPPVCAFVSGNCDRDYYTCDFDPVCENELKNGTGFPYQLKAYSRQTLTVCHKTILISHGHLHGVDFGDDLFISEALAGKDVCVVHGHTHVARQETSNGITFINPGSISKPRDITEGRFAIIDIRKNMIDAAFIGVKHWSTRLH